ncbi:MAG: redox-sensitive bicupin YhaK (pirin superfamily) [Patiriisocius sp.]|jgi:redox-sensitive bicupin YhaK (pirin superfamily)
MRSIKKKTKAFKVNMGGVMLEQALPYKGTDQVDPFLLIHHWSDKLKGGQKQQNVGVGPHPHRGFAPVTFIFNGGVHHRDSEGHESIVSAGGTQWMNSGKGIIHSERPTKELAENGGQFEIIQFWINAPAKNKLDTPKYQPLENGNTPKLVSDDGKISVGVVAGELNGVCGIIESYSDLLVLRMDYKAGGKMTIPVDKEFNALFYNLDGNIIVNGEGMEDKDMLEFNNDGSEVILETKTAGRAILLSGRPINEPLATYGPFVMNTQQEIMDAVADYQGGKMGRLIEKFD